MKIKPYSKNPKKHPEIQLKAIAKSIKEFGWQQPIVVDKEGVIIVGHGRWFAYEKFKDEMDLPKPEIKQAGNLTKQQVKAYRLVDNKLNESDWDMGLVIEELKGLSEEMFDLTGFDADLLIESDAKDDVIPDSVPKRAKTGDIWQLGRHRVMVGDSTKREDIEKLMDGKKADIIITDPPYGMNLNTDWSGAKSKLKFYKEKGCKGQGGKYEKVIGDEKDFDPRQYLEFFKHINEQFWWGADYYKQFIPNIGSWIVWDKRSNDGTDFNKISQSDKMYGSCFELCWSKNKHKREIARIKWAGIFGTEREPEHKRFHPTQKPVELSSWFVKHFSGEKSLVIDLFLGSGSTIIAAEKTGRICYGMEIDPKYVDVIIKRYEDYVGGKAKKINKTRRGKTDSNDHRDSKQTRGGFRYWRY